MNDWGLDNLDGWLIPVSQKENHLWITQKVTVYYTISDPCVTYSLYLGRKYTSSS